MVFSGRAPHHRCRLSPPQGGIFRPLIHQNYFTKVETAINCSVNLHLWASFTYLSPGFYVDHEDVALGGVGPFFHELTKEKYSDVQKPLETSTENPGCHGSRPSHREELEPGCFGPLGPGFCPSRPPPPLWLQESCILDEQVKLTEKMGDHVTNLHRLADPQAELDRELFLLRGGEWGRMVKADGRPGGGR
ncbi:hypothetical protein Celaphus_00014598 [Cervus elaphus hippelaphus]|uniref:Ferritin light chain n=1 Tax=Cervus elaphus hippelaphus TaxID=46360 RepID=A0A212D470_CEREH|nr:hypothetical protein Celaphus_00014598 [Cervus elaphus hippelaphus]